MLAKIGADTAENEQNFAENFAKNWQLPYGAAAGGPLDARAAAAVRPRRQVSTSSDRLLIGKFCKILTNFDKFCNFVAGLFSAVSKRIFARKYAFDSIFQALQDLHPFAPLQSQNFRKIRFENSAIL